MISKLGNLLDSSRLNQVFIDGKWCDAEASGHVPVVNPASEEVVAELTLGSAADVDRAVAAARRAFPGWAATPLSDRIHLLGKVHSLLLERVDVFASVLALEMGAPISYGRSAQVPLAAEHLRAAMENASSYPFVSRRGDISVLREPIGVCGLITPWNWPLYQIAAKVGPALAVGCTVVLKPSELSPLNALLFAEVIAEAGIPAGVFNLVNGNGEGVGAALAGHPEVDMVSITGSTRAGILVAQTAATTVKRVAQELGGKSANIVLPDADLPRAIPLGVGACFRNLGQSCSAPTRMLVPRDKLADVEALARDAVSGFVVGDPASEASTHGPIANRAQFERVRKMIETGIAEGARLVCGGPGRPEGLDRGYYVRPTVFSAVTPEMTIAREEIFGPVLSIIPYDSVDQAVAMANDTVYGLAAHIQGRDSATIRDVAARLRCGQVHVNHPAWSPHAPFGGYKQSGNGREFGVEGLDEYLETKAVLGLD